MYYNRLLQQDKNNVLLNETATLHLIFDQKKNDRYYCYELGLSVLTDPLTFWMYFLF